MRQVWKVTFVLATLVAPLLSRFVHEALDEDTDPPDGVDDEGPPDSVDENPPDSDVDTDQLSEVTLRTMHDAVDMDHDGKLSMSEFMHFSKETRKDVASKDVEFWLNELDSNEDGKLSLEELQEDDEEFSGPEAAAMAKDAALRKELNTEKFKVADANGDGYLDKNELPGFFFFPEVNSPVLEVMTNATLKNQDKDGDGLLTPAEFWGRNDTGFRQNDFRKLDKDGSGKLDFEELKAWESGDFDAEVAMKTLLDMADTNGDMHINADELAKAKDKLHETPANHYFMTWVENYKF